MTGCARTDYLHADDAELSPTRSITIGVQVAGRGGGDASEAIVTAMKGPRRRTTKASALVAALLATILAGCGQQTSSTNTNTNTTPLTASGASTSSTGSVATREASTTARTPGRRSSGAGRQSERGLAYSTASAQIVQPQPASGSCHATGDGPLLTPGSALHPRRAQPGRHPGQHPPDDLPRGLDRHDTAARERHRARESREHDRLRRRRADQLLRI